MPVVMGTAGHIDHGKTSLVRALTGTDCDRLEEEKRRGITIELGFAFLELPGGRRLSVVDVPGHERFVKNMVAGAQGIDFVTLVIAADEGVMPQTREHLEICALLGINRGLVALTKIDMVDADWLALVTEDVRNFLRGTFLEEAAVFPVSAHTGQGLEDLKAALDVMEREFTPRRRNDLARLPIDRVFTMRGHGTVVTGTLLSGALKVGDDVKLYPSGRLSKARGLQSHGKATELAPAGYRTAVNLQNLEVTDVDRGEQLARPGDLFPAMSWLVELSCLKSSPRALRNRTEVHFHHCTRETQARLYLPDREKLEPGATAVCELRFSEPMVGVFGDRCVLRSFSPLRTVAGGMLIQPMGLELRRKDKNFARRLELLAGLSRVEPEAALLAHLELYGLAGASFAALRVLLNLESGQLDKLLQTLGSRGLLFCVDKEERIYLKAEAVAELQDSCLDFVREFHRLDPMKPGLGRGELASGWGRELPPKLTHFVLERLLKQGSLASEGDVLRLAGHTVSLASDQEGLRRAILEAHAKAGLAPPNMKDVLEQLKVSQKSVLPLLKILQDSGELLRVADGLYYHGPALREIMERVTRWFDSHDDLDPAGLKEITGLSRKYLIALLEYFDQERLTIRVGDKRLLRAKQK